MVHTAADLAATFTARYPTSGQVGSISASASQVGSIEAAGVRSFSAVSGKLVWVRALDHFYVPGPTFIPAGDYIQVQESDAADLRSRGQATLASDAEVAAAQADAAAKVADAALRASKGSK